MIGIDPETSNSLREIQQEQQPIREIDTSLVDPMWEEDVVSVHFPHCDALVVRAVVACNGLKCMLVDNDSSINILFRTTFDKMAVDHELTPMSSPLYGFTGDIIIPRGKITLAVEIGASPQVAHHFMEFLIVDRRSTYHGVLGRPTLKGL
ncbi:unnamed protein product [Fraxinus pennsylvanica]|uniref:Uncharacterized protein n=1 Tax=Fraxinus pennsylvanica TaxID=56036 RepID=A0AAD1Z9I4_9LAMI|nr:unnamed protein product [Fraxinus pennsylvanica]